MSRARGSASGVGAPRMHADGPDAGVEAETLTKVQMRSHFGAVRIPHVRKAHRPEQNRIRRSAPRIDASGSATPVRR